jgi:hypothetical protein
MLDAPLDARCCARCQMLLLDARYCARCSNRCPLEMLPSDAPPDAPPDARCCARCSNRCPLEILLPDAWPDARGCARCSNRCPLENFRRFALGDFLSDFLRAFIIDDFL